MRPGCKQQVKIAAGKKRGEGVELAIKQQSIVPAVARQPLWLKLITASSNKIFRLEFL